MKTVEWEEAWLGLTVGEPENAESLAKNQKHRGNISAKLHLEAGSVPVVLGAFILGPSNGD